MYTLWIQQKNLQNGSVLFSRELQHNSEKDMLLIVTVAFSTHSNKSQRCERTWPHVFYLQSAQRVLELKKIALWVSRTKKEIHCFFLHSQRILVESSWFKSRFWLLFHRVVCFSKLLQLFLVSSDIIHFFDIKWICCV